MRYVIIHDYENNNSVFLLRLFEFPHLSFLAIISPYFFFHSIIQSALVCPSVILKEEYTAVCFLSLCISQNVLYYFHKLTTHCAAIYISSQLLTFEIDLDFVPLSLGISCYNPEVWVQPDFLFLGQCVDTHEISPFISVVIYFLAFDRIGFNVIFLSLTVPGVLGLSIYIPGSLFGSIKSFWSICSGLTFKNIYYPHADYLCSVLSICH